MRACPPPSHCARVCTPLSAVLQLLSPSHNSLPTPRCSAGIFIPTMAIGAAGGRLFGRAVQAVLNSMDANLQVSSCCACPWDWLQAVNSGRLAGLAGTLFASAAAACTCSLL